MSWRFIEGDIYTHGRLRILKKHYEDKIVKDFRERERLLRYRKYGIPGIRWMILHSQMEWESNVESLHNVELAIASGQGKKDRDIDIQTHAAGN